MTELEATLGKEGDLIVNLKRKRWVAPFVVPGAISGAYRH